MTDHRRAYMRQYMRTRYHGLKRMGLCVVCKQKPHPGSAYCWTHLLERRQANWDRGLSRPYVEGGKGRRPMNGG